MPKTRIAINGFGRIGRTFFRLAYGRPELLIVAVNDLGDPENLAYLLKYDSAYKQAPFGVALKSQNGKPALVINDPIRNSSSSNGAGQKTIPILNQREPSQLPWKE